MGVNIVISMKTDNGKEVLQALDDAINKFLVEAGEHLEGEAKDELENDPRRIDTGNLRNSISNVPDFESKAVHVGTNVDYAIYVHEGTRKMEANRFLKNAFEKNADQVRSKLKEALSGD